MSYNQVPEMNEEMSEHSEKVLERLDVDDIELLRRHRIFSPQKAKSHFLKELYASKRRLSQSPKLPVAGRRIFSGAAPESTFHLLHTLDFEREYEDASIDTGVSHENVHPNQSKLSDVEFSTSRYRDYARLQTTDVNEKPGLSLSDLQSNEQSNSIPRSNFSSQKRNPARSCSKMSSRRPTISMDSIRKLLPESIKHMKTEREQIDALIAALELANKSARRSRRELRKCLDTFEEYRNASQQAFDRYLRKKHSSVQRECVSKSSNRRDRLSQAADQLVEWIQRHFCDVRSPTLDLQESFIFDDLLPEWKALLPLLSRLRQDMDEIESNVDNAIKLADLARSLSVDARPISDAFWYQDFVFRLLKEDGTAMTRQDLAKQLAHSFLHTASKSELVYAQYRQNTKKMHSIDYSSFKDTISITRSEFDQLKSQLTNQMASFAVDMKCMSAQIENAIARASHSSRAAKLDSELREYKEINARLVEAYRKESNWRRLLHNQVLELNGKIRVICRICPSMGEDQSDDDPCCVIFDEQSPTQLTVRMSNSASRSYDFDLVLGPSATQNDSFDPAADLITSVLDGFKSCIIAYGQTSSGKTHLLFGSNKFDGIAFQATNQLFQRMSSRGASHTYQITISALAIYDQHVYDMFGDDPNTILNVSKGLRGIVEVSGGRLVAVSSVDEAHHALQLIAKQRRSQFSREDERISRSHCIIRIRVFSRSIQLGTEYNGTLTLVDLAGSDTMEREHAPDHYRRDRLHIHNSLEALGNVFQTLSSRPNHIPNIEDDLTYILSDTLNGGNVLFYVCVRRSESSRNETIHSMTFAKKVRSVILPKPSPNVKSQSASSRYSTSISNSSRHLR